MRILPNVKTRNMLNPLVQSHWNWHRRIWWRRQSESFWGRDINNDSLTNLIWKDSVVALHRTVTGSTFPFMLHLMVSSNWLKLFIRTPEYGHTYFLGAKVIKGYYCSYTKTTRDGCFYKKLMKEAIVPKESILHVGVDLQSQGKSPELYLLKPIDECDIMCAISI